jgi:hypothetical protein
MKCTASCSSIILCPQGSLNTKNRVVNCSKLVSEGCFSFGIFFWEELIRGLVRVDCVSSFFSYYCSVLVFRICKLFHFGVFSLTLGINDSLKSKFSRYWYYIGIEVQNVFFLKKAN